MNARRNAMAETDDGRGEFFNARRWAARERNSIVRTQQEIEDLLRKALVLIARKKFLLGCTYEEGVLNTLYWLCDCDQGAPL